MSMIGNTPGVSSQRTVLETVVTGSPRTNFVPQGGYVIGYVDVLVNGTEIDSSDFTAADGVNINLAVAAAVGDTVKVKAWLPRGLSDGYLKTEADAKFLALAGGTMTGALAVPTFEVNTQNYPAVAIKSGVSGVRNWRAFIDAAATGLGTGSLIFRDDTAAANRVSIDTSGNMSLLAGNLVLASGKGIDFSANSNASSMASEVLDDYEYGTWTPTIDASGGLSGLNAGTHYYTKIGKLVTVYGEISFTSAVVGTAYIVLRVPFNHNQAGGTGLCGVCNAYPTDNNRQSGIVIDNSSGDAYGTYLGFYVSSSGSGSVKWNLTYQSA